MACFSPGIEQQKQFYTCKANDLGVVWCSRQIVYRRLLKNCLHDKATELCLANSWNNSVTTTKYIKYINSIHAYVFLSRRLDKVL